MSESQPSAFGKFVPGFDFLQNLAKGATQHMPTMPSMSSWVAPTLKVEELEKRIEEMKAVQFWLDQNVLALKATIQALEVQKMTLATLQGMNVSMGEVAKAFMPKPVDLSARSGGGFRAASEPAPARSAAARFMRASEEDKRDEDKSSGNDNDGAASSEDAPAAASGKPGMIDPMQWWSALTQQFQQIATSALKETTATTALDATRNMAESFAKETMKNVGAFTKSATAGKRASPTAAARRAPAKKAAPRRRSGS